MKIHTFIPKNIRSAVLYQSRSISMLNLHW